MSDRERILRRIRDATTGTARHPGPHPAPDLVGDWSVFSRMLERVGGEPHGPIAPDELCDYTQAFAADWAEGGRVAADAKSLERLGPGPWQGVDLDVDPHRLEDVAVAIVWGRLGVAENAAVAVEGGGVRALPFLAERLILLLEATAVVPDMHRALRALPAAVFATPHLTWISGPSKTADIEMTLVMGAHGPRRLGVVAIDEGGDEG